MADILYKEEAYKIIGRCMSVYNELGAGFLEEVYQEALDKIIVELKAVSVISPAHLCQLANYLSATGLKLGLVVNFGNTEKLEWRRHIQTPKKLREDSPDSFDSCL